MQCFDSRGEMPAVVRGEVHCARLRQGLPPAAVSKYWIGGQRAEPLPPRQRSRIVRSSLETLTIFLSATMLWVAPPTRPNGMEARRVATTASVAPQVDPHFKW